jgi:hypothetical protein
MGYGLFISIKKQPALGMYGMRSAKKMYIKWLIVEEGE